MRPLIIALGLAAAACGVSDDPPAGQEGCADVEGVDVALAGDRSFSFSVTISSADTGWDKYADAFEVVAPDGSVLGTRILAHPHADEQPFTRTLGAVDIPAGVGRVTVRARDSVAGFCGAEMTVELP